MTGGRVKRVRRLVGRRDVLLTYGDGVATSTSPSWSRSTARTAPGHRDRGAARRAASAPADWRKTARVSRGFREKPRATAPGSTAASSCSSRRSSTTSRATTRVGARAAGDAWRPTGSSRPTSTRLLAAHGHAARQDAARGLWARARRPGRSGDRSRFCSGRRPWPRHAPPHSRADMQRPSQSAI